jgi:hypothetical protein
VLREDPQPAIAMGSKKLFEEAVLLTAALRHCSKADMTLR